MYRPNPEVYTQEQLDEILSEFETLDFEELPEEYLEKSKSNHKKYKKHLEDASYLIIQRNDFYKKIAGKFRIRDFVCKDKFYKACLLDKEKNFYWLIDKKLLEAVIKLLKTLEEKELNKDALRITYGHRHPAMNEKIKGAKQSRHIHGEAIDMVVGDIDNDGKYSSKDKKLLIDILEKEIIKDKGGIGKYPGTRTVHMDTRGYRARWNSY